MLPPLSFDLPRTGSEDMIECPFLGDRMMWRSSHHLPSRFGGGSGCGAEQRGFQAVCHPSLQEEEKAWRRSLDKRDDFILGLTFYYKDVGNEEIYVKRTEQ